MEEKILVFDQQKCTGCRLCELACSTFHTGESNPKRSRIKVAKRESMGVYLPLTCNHCERAYCVESCPAGACHRDPEMIHRVVIDKDKCIGCKSCVLSCPFGHPFFDMMERVSVKCNHCDGDPQCVAFCNPKAINYITSNKSEMFRKRKSANKLFESSKQLRK
jgi:carbon-monoxide dehydrogenase iron sulfur subunit